MYCLGVRNVRDPAVLTHPVVGWIGGGVTAEGVLDAEAGGDWVGSPCRAPICAGVGSPAAGIGPRWRMIVESEHSAPSPFCRCGLAVHADAPFGRWRDRYRDRLGYRMQTAALVVTWGRVIVERDCVRGEHGRVLALLVSDDDSPPRRRRMEYAARRLGAEIVEISPDSRPPDWRALADRIGASFGRRLGRAEAAALLRRRDVRRWQTLSRHSDDGAQLALQGVILGVVLSAGGLTAAGIPPVASAVIVAPPAIALSVRIVRNMMRGLVQVEALTTTGDGRSEGEAIALAPPRHMFGGPPAKAVGDVIRDTLD